jgi:hypothetical protein
MPKKERKKITEHRQKLANALTVGESPSADKNAQQAVGYRAGGLTEAIASPEVARAVKAQTVRRLITEAAPLAMGLLMKAAKAGHKAYEAGEQATSAQLDAAKSLMQFAGMQAAGESLAIEKDPGEMSGAELEEAIRKSKDLEQELARRNAVTVDGVVSAPSDAPIEGQAIEAKDNLFS